ncbi:MAG TPA: ABC transporter permease [Candidatus Acidoferrales bacterium]|nr:ABC transporter permease [Candidatus Acidoferrales bacterium]
MFADTLALTARSLKKWIRNPAAIMPGVFMAVFWLALFGSSFNPVNLVPSKVGGTSLSPTTVLQIKSAIGSVFGGAANYITFLTAGIITLIVIINMAYGGIDIVLDRQLGYLNSLLTSPISRASIFFSGALQNFVKAMFIAVITFIVAVLLPNGLQVGAGFGVLNLLGIFAAIALVTFGFGCLFTSVAFSVKVVDSLIAIINFLAFPLVFMSSAMFPLGTFPSWLKGIAQVNPVTKAVETARLLIVNGNLTASQLSTVGWNMLYLVVFASVLAVAGYLIARRALKAE